MKYYWAIFFSLCMVASSYAGEAVPLAEDPVVEQRLVTIAEDLRCLVCQNESLAGSRSELAIDLRREIRALIKANKTDLEIMEFMVNRYGDFVLYRPPVKPTTWLLWFGPFFLLLVALILLVRLVHRSQRILDSKVLDDAQRKKAQSLLNDLDRSP
jgi:cytochrome c-type biogenesis protein CcmH